MSRRRAVRRPRRVQVQFWRRGEPTAYIGYTTNISMTGMYVATNSPMPSGARIRVEILDRDRGFMVEGVVAHALRARGDVLMPSITHMISYLVVMIPLSWWLAIPLGYGLNGIIGGIVVASFISAGLLLWRWWVLARRY